MGGPPTTLDDAWASWIAGRSEDAVRACVAMLEADPTQVGAAELIAHALHAEGTAAPKGLVDVFVRRGDLPSATGVAHLTADPKAALKRIAAAFGKGSKRAADVAPAPPPLPPGELEIDGQLKKLKGDGLQARAKAALAEVDADRPEDSKVPILPLFGAMSPPALEQLLGAWKPRALAPDEVAIHEGDEGKEAFVVARGHLRAVRGGPEETVLAELGPGAIFGEMSLVSDAPRAASVSANEAVLLLVASRAALEKLAKKTKIVGTELSAFCRARMLSNLTRHSAILSAVSHEDRAGVIQRFESRQFKAGERLVTFEEETEGLFLIASGAVQVIGRDADGDALELARLGPGDVVGEISLVLRRPATADVVATHQTVALELKREQFQSAIKEHPELLSELYDLATKRDEETRSVVAQETLDVEDVVLL